MARDDKFGYRDQKYGMWHRSLPHNHGMTDFDQFDISERTLFGIFANEDEDGDDICKFVMECKEIQYSGGYYKLPYLDRNQYDCLRSFCKRYNKQGDRSDIPFFVVCYSIDVENDKRWFVVYAGNDACKEKLKKFYGKNKKSVVMSESGYIRFLSFMIERKIGKKGSHWMPQRILVDDDQFKKSMV